MNLTHFCQRLHFQCLKHPNSASANAYCLSDWNSTGHRIWSKHRQQVTGQASPVPETCSKYKHQTRTNVMKLASKSNIYIDILHYLLCLIMSVPVTLKATYCITNSIILVLSFYRGPVSWILACAKLHLQRVQFLTLAQLDCTGNHQLLITHNKSHLFTNLHLLKERDSINELSS